MSILNKLTEKAQIAKENLANIAEGAVDAASAMKDLALEKADGYVEVTQEAVVEGREKVSRAIEELKK